MLIQSCVFILKVCFSAADICRK